MNMTNMIDMAEVYSKSSSYMDFEGMTDAGEVLKACRNADGKYVWDDLWSNDPHYYNIRALTLHYVHQSIDQGDAVPPYDLLLEVCAWIGTSLKTRWFSAVSDEEIQRIEARSERRG